MSGVTMSSVKVIRVSTKTPVPQLAGSIVISVESGDNVELKAVGAGAVNQMYKGLASARGILANKGKDLLIRPGFNEVVDGDTKKTLMVARVIMQ